MNLPNPKIIKEGEAVQAVGRYGPQVRYTLGGNTVVVDEMGRIITTFGPRPGNFIPFK